MQQQIDSILGWSVHNESAARELWLGGLEEQQVHSWRWLHVDLAFHLAYAVCSGVSSRCSSGSPAG